MSSDGPPKKSRGRGGRGRGRGGGRGGRGRGGRGTTDGNNAASNFAGRGPKTFGAGPGPSHFGKEPARPSRIDPRLPTDSSDEEEDDEAKPPAGGGADGTQAMAEDEHLDHPSPINATPSHRDAPTDVDHVMPVHAQPRQRPTHAYCLICYSSKLHDRRTISPCGHDDVCWQCHLQMRYLHNDIKCPVCKSANDTLIVDHDDLALHETDADDGAEVHHKRFGEYHLWGNDLGNGYVYREDVGMHFPTRVYEEHVMPLLGYGCGLPNCEFTNTSDTFVTEKELREEQRAQCTTVGGDKKNETKPSGRREVKKRLTGLKALKTHLRIDHGYALCELCVEHKRDFVSKLSRYTPQGLKVHQSKGDGEHSGFAGHPLCEFCRPKRFYDIVKLHEHLNKEHYKCHICDKLGKPNQFFKDYPRLERHFDRDHYLCHDAQCLQARFVVFENELDLRGHERSVHGTGARDGGTKIKLEFRVRREGEVLESQTVPSGEDFQFGLNGEAFVPEALPGEEEEQRRQLNEPDISHPLHAARTAELRAQAARVREREGIASAATGGGGGEAFPSLAEASSDAAAGGGMLIGWTADGVRSAAGGRTLKRNPVGKVTEEEFPSLGPGPGAASSRNRKKIAQKLSVGRKSNGPGQITGPNFSAMASRPTSSTSTPFTSASYSSSIPAASAPDMTRDNFPSLGIGNPRPLPSYPAASSSLSRAAPNLNSANNFPSLGGGSARRPQTSSMQQSNPYAAAQAHARKLNTGRGPGSAPAASAYPALSDFPPPPSSSGKKSNVKAAFAPKKPPPMDNVLQFPLPSSSAHSAAASSKPSSRSLQAGKQTVESLKQTLGSVRYKKLKSLTKDFAMGDTNPEAYVDSAASLFDRGIGDEAFWEHISSLINDIPNKGAVDRAMRHLEGLRMANQMQELEFGGGAREAKRPINYVLPTKKKGNSWGNGSASTGAKIGAAPNSMEAPMLAASNPAKKSGAGSGGANANANATGGKGKKSKAKKRNNELKALAFGA